MNRTSVTAIALFAASCAYAQTQSGATFGQIIGLGGTPSDIVLDELRGRLYLVNNFANRVDIYGIAEKQIVGSIGVGLTPLAAAISMDSAYLFVTNQQSSSLSVIDLGTRTVAQTVTLPAKPEGVAVGSDGRALISTAGTGTGNPPANTAQDAAIRVVAVPPTPTPTVPPPPSCSGLHTQCNPQNPDRCCTHNCALTLNDVVECCVPLQRPCSTANDCCAPAGNAIPSCPAGTCCLPDGQACSIDADCCTGSCVTGTCTMLF